MPTYHYVLASQRFLLEEEPFEEVLKERQRNYQENNKEIDFWLVKQPAFLEAPAMKEIKAKCPQPSVAVVSTNPSFITWLKLRLEYVITGQFEAPSDAIPDAIASLEKAVV
ncbi:MgPME-cyclase complex family protein [[Phormidium] sp. ETS-05]|uniref:MgPME-cyclase complex family protein n=1 Tax=[Phormidium] sp. ETS-05 TaxID=222819 RepID=UPI0018EF0B2B|nr:MgPME-cyclase complex family protein [[Phormidium] sp. ETS-05]